MTNIDEKTKKKMIMKKNILYFYALFVEGQPLVPLLILLNIISSSSFLSLVERERIFEI